MLQCRWSPTHPNIFAVSTNALSKGAVIHVHNTTYINAQPTPFNIAPRPLYVRDFDFLATKNVPFIAAAVGKQLYVFQIGIDL